MATHADPVREITNRLHEAGLIPPVRAVEQRAGGWVHVLVPAPISQDVRSRVTAALGPGRWTLREHVGGTSYR